MYQVILVMHIAAGLLALISGLGAIISAKGKQNHNRSGQTYYISMYVVAFSAIVLSLLKFNSFYWLLVYFLYI